MIFRKTHKTKQKKIYRDSLSSKKEYALYRVYTYWFLFLPVYQYEEFIS
jgi:hypothetical protein